MNTIKKPQSGDIFSHDFSFTEEQVSMYAEISGDNNPIHISESYAGQTKFGRCIVHGYFSISVFSKVYGTLLYPDGHLLISQNAKYLKPIFSGIEYTAFFKVKQLFPEKNRVMYLNEIFEKGSGQLKITGEAILMNKKYYQW